MRRYRKYKWTLMSLVVFMSCSLPQNESTITVADPLLYINPQETMDNYRIQVNTSNILTEGIIIPYSNGDANSTFKLKAKIEISPEKEQEYFYKIYYQNSSYKYNEKLDDGTYNIKSAENFYGSWEEVNIGFKSLGIYAENTQISLLDSFRIIGNPRDEMKFYGIPQRPAVSKDLINSNINRIKNNKDWYDSVIDKAVLNHISTEEQLYLDALWQIEYSLHSDYSAESYNQELEELYNQILANEEWKNTVQKKANQNKISFEIQAKNDAQWILEEKGVEKPINHRFKRNPRMGEYEVMLVIVSKEALNLTPDYIINISKKEETRHDFVNPFYYFNSKEIKNVKGVLVYPLLEKITVSIAMGGENGIYVDPLSIRNPNYTNERYTESINDGENLYHSALYKQYFHVINKDFKLKNVPFAADVVNDPYTKNDYEINKNKYKLENREISHTQITDSPGKTVFYNDSLNAIQLINPGSSTDLKKENVGVMTRVGMVYGKYTAKIKFPDILNTDNLWNGVTCAFWLFSEDMHSWNSRDICEQMGYLPKGAKSFSEEREKSSTYSEIDIEIVKTSKYWPKTSYIETDNYPIDKPEDNRNLIITTTNWDLACRDPKNFNQGVKEIEKDNKKFQLHRWDNWYQALTSKYEYPHNKTVGSDLYYQIEWKPNEIIWRIGPDKNNLDIIGYMNSDNTKIPNNQMVAIITQEFHYSLWWPLAPFDQNNIPFPKNDINGYVYSIEIE